MLILLGRKIVTINGDNSPPHALFHNLVAYFNRPSYNRLVTSQIWNVAMRVHDLDSSDHLLFLAHNGKIDEI